MQVDYHSYSLLNSECCGNGISVLSKTTNWRDALRALEVVFFFFNQAYRTEIKWH